MRIGLLVPTRLAGATVALADALLEAGHEVATVVGAGPPAWMPSRLDRGLGALRRHGPLGAALRWRGGPADASDAGAHGPSGSTSVAWAAKHGIPHVRVATANDEAAATALRAAGVEVVVARGVGILRPVLLDAPGLVFLNAHAGRLPRYGGMSVVEWAVLEGDPVFGTLHRIARGIDTGDLLLERPLDLGRPRTVAELRARASAAVWALLPDALRRLEAGEIAFRPQPAAGSRRQWFRMHPALRARVQAALDDGRWFAVQDRALRSWGVDSE